MSILIVVESMFGNSFEVAEAIADGVRSTGRDVEVTRVADAPKSIDPAVTLLLRRRPHPRVLDDPEEHPR